MKFWPFADVILIFTEWPYRKPPLWLLGFMGIVGVTFLWSTDPFAPLLFALRSYLIWSAVTRVVRTRVYVWLAAGLLGNVAGVMLTFPALPFDGNDYRFSFQYENPELLGAAAITLFMSWFPYGWIAGVGAGLAGARAALVVMGLFFILNPSKYLLFGLVVGVVVFTYVRPDGFTLGGIKTFEDQRTETLTGEGTAPIGNPVDNRILKLPWHVFGYGYHAYNDREAKETPHVLPLLIISEMGPFGTSVIATLLWHYLSMNRRNWKLVVPALPYFLVTDSIWYFPSGHYFAGALALVWLKGPVTMNKKDYEMHYRNGYKRRNKIVNT